MAQTPFDPYHQWLDLPVGHSPGNYYELLKLETFESDPAVIARSAEMIATRIRRVHPGEHLAEWQRVLDAVSSARACLLDPSTKAAYDARLRAQLSPLQPIAAPRARTSVAGDADSGVNWASLRQKVPGLLAVGLCIMLVVVAAAYYRYERQQQIAAGKAEKAAGQAEASEKQASASSDASATRPLAKAPALEPASIAAQSSQVIAAQESSQPDRTAPASVGPSKAVDAAASEPAPQPAASAAPGPTPTAARVTASASPVTDAPAAAVVEPVAAGGGQAEPLKDAAAEPAPGPQVDSQKQDLYRRAVAAARAAMARRDLSGARRQLKTAAKLLQTPEEKAEAARLETLVGHLEEFYRALAKVVLGLAPAQEFTIGNTPMIVVEATPTRLLLRSEGRNHSYTMNNLPRPIVEVLVQTGLPDNAATKVPFGAYLAFDPQGDRQMARKLWREAIDAGQNIGELLLELDLAAPDTAAQAPKAPAARTTIQKTDLPTDPGALQQADEAVRAQFQIDYNLASGASGKLKLADRLLEAAAGGELAPATRFVMLRDARDNALAAGKPEKACTAIDEMGRYFTVDPLDMKVTVLEQFGKMARTAAGNKELTDSALGLVNQATKAGRLDQAGRLAAVAVAAAQRVRNAALVRQALDVQEKIDAEAQKAAEKAAKKKG